MRSIPRDPAVMVPACAYIAVPNMFINLSAPGTVVLSVSTGASGGAPIVSRITALARSRLGTTPYANAMAT